MTDIEIIKDKVRIVDLCNQAGLEINRDGKILCFIHDEKTPSLQINEKENYFK